MASLVYLHNKSNGVTYVYSNHSYRDKETHKVKHDRKCIGHLDPDSGEIVNARLLPSQSRLQNPARLRISVFTCWQRMQPNNPGWSAS